MPNTSTLPAALSVIAAAPQELPTTHHRRGRAATLDVVVVKNQVNVHDSEQDEEPHHGVVPLPDTELAAHQRHNPAEHLRQESLAHAGVKRKSGRRLKQKRQKVNEPRQRVMTQRDVPAELRLQYIDLQHFADFLNLDPLIGDEIRPAREGVAYESPVDSRQEREKEHEGGDEMGESDRTEPVLLIRL